MKKHNIVAMRVACLALGALAAMHSVYAAERVDVSQIDLATASSFSAMKTISPVSFELHLQQALQLDPRNTFRELRKTHDKANKTHTRYQQFFDGVPVYGEQVIAHSDSQGPVRNLTGRAVDGLENDLDANDIRVQDFSSAAAMEKAKKNVIRYMGKLPNVTPSYRNEKIELVVFLDDKAVGHDAWYISYVAEAQGVEPVRPFFIIDADDGDILKTWNGMAHSSIGTGPGGNKKTGLIEYGVDRPFLDVTQVSSTCTMNNAAVKTVNMGGGTGAYETAYSYSCPRNTYQYINDAYSPINDAHYFANVTDAMYQSYVSSDPLVSQIIVRVHYSTEYENAFWDGTYTNFGDGKDYFYPMSSSLNVVAHEISHGTTEQNSGLEYVGQSGGINEAYSDIAGEAAEYYAYNAVDWLIGADVTKGKSKALRYFADPTQDKVSIGNAADYYDDIDVHYSSGVFNRAYYLLANTAGWNPQKAFEVFYYANVNYWVPTSNYVDAACGVLSAAGDLAYDRAQVNAAFVTVGIVCPAPLLDVDADYMDDNWETAHGLNPSLNDSADDPDGDGLSNREEYFAGTDPHDADSDGDNISDAYDPLPNDGDWLGLLAYDTVINHADGAKSMAGFSVASADVDGDGSDDIIVGSPYYDYKYRNRRYTDIGFVAVISGATNKALWFNIGSYKGELFGFSVAGTSDLDNDGIADFVVGAPGYVIPNYATATYDKVGRVAAYSVFNVDANTGQPFAINEFIGHDKGDRFGASVANAGHTNNNSYNDIIVGAPGVDTTDGTNLFKDAGAVFVYEVITGQTVAQYLNGVGKSFFGTSVAGIGDITGDGYDDVIAGAPLDDSNGKDSGSVFILTPVNSGYHNLYLTGLHSGDRFGTSVSSAGDVNNDGIPDFMAGYPYGGTKGSGGVAIFLGRGNSTQIGSHITIEGMNGKDHAGASIASVADVNNDGKDDILVGSPGADIFDPASGKTLVDAGRVQLFSGANGDEIWSVTGKAAKDYFGGAVASGDINKDGAGDAVIGAKGADVSGGSINKPHLTKDAGSVSIINGKASSP
ncbi:MAG TPA: M4 family metallopeptidase [Pseudomonadales bacterium]|nr:M4 family metallopeptidase [Pseudomonadales bacterium]